jgi:glycosyltransferase involved in cell wall biosynthesis
VIVFCGAISKFRKLDDLIRAFAIVAKQMENARFLMIGDGNALQECKLLATSLKLRGKFILQEELPIAN